jgi:RES domain-containing protein
MRLWRLARAKYPPFDGAGALRFSSRWHRADGVLRLVYTSEALSLAALELLVHTEPDLAPADLLATAVDLPDGLAIRELSPAELPAGWAAEPAPPSLQVIGTDWLRSGVTPLLRVPSAIIPEEWNVLINVAHPVVASSLVPAAQRPFSFDSRLWKTAASAPSKA